jgi:hypothetical protein
LATCDAIFARCFVRATPTEMEAPTRGRRRSSHLAACDLRNRARGRPTNRCGARDPCGARRNAGVQGGTESSNLLCSSRESGANLTSTILAWLVVAAPA